MRARQVRRLLLARQTTHGARTLAALARLENPPQVLGFDLPLERWKAELFRTVDASLTLARAGIADTGSLVLWPDADEPRSMSLVPPVHFVLWDTQYPNPHLASMGGRTIPRSEYHQKLAHALKQRADFTAHALPEPQALVQDTTQTS